MFLNTSIYLSLVIIILGCNGKVHKADDFKVLNTDTSITHGNFNEINFSKEISESLNLPYIHNGVDSFELRILTSGMWTRKDLFVLRFSKGKWISSNYIYYTKDIIDSAHLLQQEMTKIVSSKIQAFFISDSVIKLPSQVAIPNFRDSSADGISYLLEVSTPKFYKVLYYHNPKLFADAYNQQFVRILNFLQPYIDLMYPY